MYYIRGAHGGAILNRDGKLRKLTLNAVMRRDYEVVQAVVLLVSLLNVLCTLLLDLLYALVDPRVRLN